MYSLIQLGIGNDFWLKLRKFPISDGLCFFVLIHKVSPSGKRKVIAVGSLDISDYIMEEPTSHDITVTLKPVKKTVLSGSLEFTLSSVILEDGIPRWVILICLNHENHSLKWLVNWCQLNCYWMEPRTCSTQIKHVPEKLVLLPFCIYSKRGGGTSLYGQCLREVLFSLPSIRVE